MSGKKHKICSSCGFVGEPIPQCPESFLVDALVWMSVISFTFMTGFLPFLMLGLPWTIFHIVKYRTTKCPECEQLDMVPLRSAKGQHALDTKHA